MILATVSDGAAICFVLLGIVVGLLIGLAVREQAREGRRGLDYAALSDAAAKAYAGVSRDIAASRALTLEQAAERIDLRIPIRTSKLVPPGMLIVTSNELDPSRGPILLRPEDFEQLAGVPAEKLRQTLMAQ